MFSRLSTQIIVAAETIAITSMLASVIVAGGGAAFANFTTWVTLFVVAVVVGAVSYWFARRITDALAKYTSAAKALGDVDVPQRQRTHDADELVATSYAIQEAALRISRAQRQSRDEIARLSTTLESMADGVIAVDDQHRVLLANAACQQMLRLPNSSIAGRPLLEVSRNRALYDAVAQSLSRPGALTTELTIGEKPPQHFLLRASRLPGEPCPGVVVVLHDVTEVRRLENIRKEFVANVSHELKTPLASIKAYAETLRLGAINDPDHNLSFVGRIEEDANRLNGLIGDMLQIARIESHQQAFKIRPINLGKQVERCAKDMAGRAESKTIQLQLFPPPQPLTVLADAEGVQTILANLVDNAIKYTPAGGTVTMRWSAESDRAVLAVEDTGMGIEAEHQSRIFERFFRVDRARNRDSGGTGLGLSIVKHLVQAFDGTIDVSSQLGQGSRFEIGLPLANTEKASD